MPNSQVIDYDLTKDLVTVSRLTGGSDKYDHGYLPLYQQHFQPYREDPTLRLLEIGVLNAASICMWRSYFHPNAYIHALDLYNLWVPPKVGFTQIDTRNKFAVQEFASCMPSWNIVIDDAGHDMCSQQVALQVFWDHIVPGGCFVMEDLHTSFMTDYLPSTHLHTTYHLVQCLQHGIKFESPWMSALTFQKIKQQVEKVDLLHVDSSMQEVNSITSVIVKKK